MNDHMEHNWLVEIAREVVRQQRPSSILEPQDEFYATLATYLSGRVAVFPFAACLSSRSDLLSQWRAYANDGSGFSIGLRSSALPRQAAPPRVDGSMDNIGLHCVIYDQGKQRKWTVEHIKDCHARAIEPGKNAGAIAWECYEAIIRAALVCKNPAFSEESEWRIIYLEPAVSGPLPSRVSGPKFTCRGNLIVPYYELPLDVSQNPIAEVVFGPKNRLERGRAAIQMLLGVKGFDSSKVSYSQSKATYW